PLYVSLLQQRRGSRLHLLTREGFSNPFSLGGAYRPRLRAFHFINCGCFHPVWYEVQADSPENHHPDRYHHVLRACSRLIYFMTIGPPLAQGTHSRTKKWSNLEKLVKTTRASKAALRPAYLLPRNTDKWIESLWQQGTNASHPV
ncbi:unnamed protein product, partial [Ectocarpus sp. 8 AP-2014]